MAWTSAVYGQIDEIPDDFFQYYLWAFMDIDTGGIVPDPERPADKNSLAGNLIIEAVVPTDILHTDDMHFVFDVMTTRSDYN